MIAAVDNPSNAVEWALAEMINRPELLERATEELDKAVGKKRLVQESDLSKLNYVKACAREAFRLHPIVALNLPHVSMTDSRRQLLHSKGQSRFCKQVRAWKKP